MGAQWFKVASKDSIPAQEGRRVFFKDKEYALFNLGNDQFMAIDNRCPHKQGPLADGIISGKAVFCPLHTWKVSLENGCVLAGGTGQVQVYPTKIIDGQVFIALNEGKFCEAPTGATLVDAPSVE